MLNSFIILFFLVILVESVTEIITSSTLFQPVRNWLAKKAFDSSVASFFSKLIQCGYCASVWIAFSCAWILQFNLVNFFIDWVIFAFVLHRLANFWHEFLSRWFSRHPIIMSINLFKTGDSDGTQSTSESEIFSEENSSN